MENVVSNAERRALASGEQVAVARVTDVYAALPSITGKFEMEYEGELKGAEAVARDLIRASVASVADGHLSHLDTRQIIDNERQMTNAYMVEFDRLSANRIPWMRR